MNKNIFRIVTTLVALCATSVAFAVPTAVAKVRSGHPRIYVTPETLPALKARCNGPMKDTFAAMRKAAWIMKGRAGVDWSDCTNMGYPAFMHLVTGRKEYLVKTKEFLDALVRKPPRNQYLTPEFIRAGCMAADWTWNDLTPAERVRYGKALIGMSEWVLAKVWRHSDFNNHFVNEHLAVLYTAVLLGGEKIEPTRVAKLMSAGREYLLKHAVPAADEIAGTLNRQSWWRSPPYVGDFAQSPDASRRYALFVGGQAEGFSYNDWGYARPLALTCEMWRVATGRNLFSGSSFFHGQSVWHAYALRPGGTFARSEDCSSGLRPGSNLKTVMHLLAARLSDPLAEWLARKWKWKYVQKGWQEVLWRDPKLEAKSPAQLSLPLAGCFQKLGHVYFRSSWEDPAAAFALFQCGPYYAGHQHLDNNTFVIHRGGSLAIDSGTNDYGSHRGNYYCRTIAHNGIVIRDPAETFSGRAWSAEGDTRGSNDGGQMRGRGVTRAGQFKPGCPSDIGRIVDFRNGRFAAACVGDATKSYSPKKLRRAVRAFYHLRGEAEDKHAIDTFVVYDQVVTTAAKFKPKWILHSIDKPEVAGDRFTITRGGGRLAGQVIWPAKAQIELVGGPGKESLVAGRNYPPAKKADAEHGSWRIEIPVGPKTLILLHAKGKGAAPPPPAKIESIDGSIGLRIKRGDIELRLLIPKGVNAVPSVVAVKNGKPVETLTLKSP